MKNASDNRENRNAEARISNAAFDAFVSDELLPRVGLTRSAFDHLLTQLTEHSVDDQPQQTLPALQTANGSRHGIHWGSLYSALYHEDAIPHCAGLRAGEKVNPARTRRVTSSVKDFLDIAFPLTDGSHHDVTSYMVYFQNLMMILADGSTAGLQNPSQFVAKIGPRDNPESILLLQNGLHVELAFDSCGAIGRSDLANINDVQIEIVKSTRSDLEAESVSAKLNQYRALMETAFSGTHTESPLLNSDSAEFTGKCGDRYNVSTSGHIVYIDGAPFERTMIADGSGKPIPSLLVDTLIASLIATGANRVRRDNSADAGPRLIVASNHSALTLRVMNIVERACRQSRIRPRKPDNKKCLSHASVNQTSADTRAEQNLLTDRGQPVIHRHCPVNNNEKATSAETNSINQAVLHALHHHGFELANLSRGLPGNRYGEQQQLQSGAYA
jgi:malate synthase